MMNRGRGVTPIGTHTITSDTLVIKHVADGDLDELVLYRSSYKLPRDYSGNSLLHIAVLNERTNVVKYLLDADVSPHTKNKQGKTAWDLALRSQNKEIVKLFSDTENQFRKINDDLEKEIYQHKNNKRIITGELHSVKQENIILRRNNQMLKNNYTELKSDYKRKRDDCDNLGAENKRLKATCINLQNSVSNLCKANRK